MSLINDNKRNGIIMWSMFVGGVLGFFLCWIMQDAQTAGHIPEANRWMVAKIVCGVIGAFGGGWLLKSSL